VDEDRVEVVADEVMVKAVTGLEKEAAAAWRAVNKAWQAAAPAAATAPAAPADHLPLLLHIHLTDQLPAARPVKLARMGAKAYAILMDLVRYRRRCEFRFRRS